MSEATRRKLGRASFVEIERSVWSITYPTLRPPFFYTIDYAENGLWLHLGKGDIDQAQKSLERVLKLFGTSVGAVGAATGTIALPGGGTVAGVLAGTLIGGTLSELAEIIVEMAKYLAVDDQGAFDLHLSPHGFQCGDNFAGDPNIFLGPLWRPIYDALKGLQPRKAGGIGVRSTGPSMDPAKVDRNKPMSGGRVVAGDATKSYKAQNVESGPEAEEVVPEGTGKKAKKPVKEPAVASGAAATSPAASKLVSLAQPVTGRLALGQTHYWKFKPSGTKLKFKVYLRLLADSYAVDGSLAVSDEDGGVLDRTGFSAAEHGEDFSVETIAVVLEEPMEMAVLSIKSKGSMSEKADFEYKIKAV